MYDYVVLDFESRSTCDIKKAGAERYWQDRTTEPSCLAWQWPVGAPEGADLLGRAHAAEALAPKLFAHVRAGRIVVVHNGRFELSGFRRLHADMPGVWPLLRPEQVVDTMALGLVYAFPASLDKMSEAMRLEYRKDKEGHAAMLRLCKPQKKRRPRGYTGPDEFYWLDSQELRDRQLRYCMADVEAEHAIYKALPPMTAEQRAQWLMDQRINDRGVAIDVDAIRIAEPVIAEEIKRIGARLAEITGGRISAPTEAGAILEWCNANGAKLPDLRKQSVVDALAGKVPDDVREVLQLRQDGGRSSVAKLGSMLAGVCEDGRAYGLHQFHGANTGRAAGRRVQTQNMIRTPDDFGPGDANTVWRSIGHPTEVYGLRAVYGSLMQAASYATRGLIVAGPGHRFVSADWANIEGRVMAWLAGEAWKLDAFREYDAEADKALKKLLDIYVRGYARSFGVDPKSVGKPQRQLGKVQELGLQYQGAHGAFVSMAKVYGVDLDKLPAAVQAVAEPWEWNRACEMYYGNAFEDAAEKLADQAAADKAFELLSAEEFQKAAEELAEQLARDKRFGLHRDVWAAIRIIVDRWRDVHPHIVEFWYALERAAIAAVASPGTVTAAGPIQYGMSGNILRCRLPSGRCIHYPYARLIQAEDFGRVSTKMVYEGVDSKTKKWVRKRAYGGLLGENVTQAAACDRLLFAIDVVEAAGYPVVMHVHDEATAEVPEGVGSLKEFEALMCKLAPWETGLPVAAEGWEGRRYRK